LRGTSVELALGDERRLRTDDCLILEDGNLIEIVAQPEALLEARAADVAALARLAWQLGDHHIPVEISERRLRVRRDPAVENLLRSAGAKVTAIEAPFEPEGGAYSHETRDHNHHHDHGSRHHGHSHD
jgi:urease accessory protein